MNITEAYNIFNLKPNEPIESFKKKHKELVKKYHPDINKEEYASQKMREVNEAFDLIKKHKEGSYVQKRMIPDEINIHKTISFADAVYGCQVNLKYTRQKPCHSCDGDGTVTVSDCTKCNGTGFIKSVQRTNFGVTTTQTNCNNCKPRQEQCKTCFGLGTSSDDVDINVRIPAGVKPNSRLILRNMGNFGIQASFFGPQITQLDAYLTINYEPNNNFSFDENNLLTKINVSFLESIKGFSKEIELPDNRKLKIDSNSTIKNKHQFVFEKEGLAKEGNLIVDVIVDDIPENKLNEIINILSNV